MRFLDSPWGANSEAKLVSKPWKNMHFPNRRIPDEKTWKSMMFWMHFLGILSKIGRQTVEKRVVFERPEHLAKKVKIHDVF